MCYKQGDQADAIGTEPGLFRNVICQGHSGWVSALQCIHQSCIYYSWIVHECGMLYRIHSESKTETDVIATHVPPAIRNSRPPPIPITCDLTDFFPFATQPSQRHLLVYPSSYLFYSHCVSLTIYSVILCISHPVHTLQPASPPFGCVHSFIRF